MRVRIPWTSVTPALNAVMVVLVLLQAGRAVVTRVRVPTPTPVAWEVGAGTVRPDVFLIVLDGHARADVLRDEYGYDMAELKEVFATNGFVESEDSYANHAVTRFSLAVLLNGRPMADLGQDMSKPADDDIAFGALVQSDGMSMFERAGYEMTVISSGFDHLPLRSADTFIDVGPRNELEQVLIDSTGIGRLVDQITNGYVASGRDRMMREVSALRRVATETRQGGNPQFVLAHLPAPHFPVVLNRDCSLRLPDKYTQRSFGSGWEKGDQIAIQAQADQTRCVDALAARAIEELVSKRPDALVVVLSDHGPEEGIDWRIPDEAGTQRAPGQSLLGTDTRAKRCLPGRRDPGERTANPGKRLPGNQQGAAPERPLLVGSARGRQVLHAVHAASPLRCTAGFPTLGQLHKQPSRRPGVSSRACPPRT